MVKFLINKPIAVSMSFLALVIIGLISIKKIPISLLPEIAVPEITIVVNKQDASAGELENTVIKPLRHQLMQTAHLTNIESSSRNTSATIKLEFEYGTNIDYAFIEVNEKIDIATSFLPRNIKRPKVIKTSASDIPIYYLNISYKNNKKNSYKRSFLELSNFAKEVIKRRIEQLPEIAIADISGTVSPEIVIIPDKKKIHSLGLKNSDIVNLLNKNNIKAGNLVIHDGQYTYNIQVGTSLTDIEEIRNLHLNVNGKIISLKDICIIERKIQNLEGLVVSDGKDAVSIAIIKQADSKIQDVATNLNKLLNEFNKDYKYIKFTITRDQTKLLDYSISNLGQSLLLSSIFAFIIMFLFLKDYRAPLLIGISIPISLIITLLFFYLFNMSLNIISLSGLVLGVGMMVDNSIIVIDNITQHNYRIQNTKNACISGTNEVITPLISSMLTTCAVFIPLIFAGGIAGALFSAQAFSISIGLFISFIVSITLLPVYYKLFYKSASVKELKIFHKINSLDYEKLYKKGYYLIMNNKIFAILLIFILITIGILAFYKIQKARLPEISKNEIMLYIDWNRNINTEQNKIFTANLLKPVSDLSTQITEMIGSQQFLINNETSTSASESLIYFKTDTPEKINKIITLLKEELKIKYPNAEYNFTEAGNIFNILFKDKKASLIAKIRSKNKLDKKQYKSLLKKIKNELPGISFSEPIYKTYLIIKTNPKLLALYNIDFDEIFRTLRQKFNKYEIFSITKNNNFIPVIIGNKQESLNKIINQTYIKNTNQKQIPLSKLISVTKSSDVKIIKGDKRGEYFPIEISSGINSFKKVISKISNIIKNDNSFDVDFSGSIFDNQRLLQQLIYILLVSILLLYFILAAQFESLSLPLIILAELIIDISGVIFFLYILGETLNLMSIIGIITMSGIVINDSILKIDTINMLIKDGFQIEDAIKEAGKRRLKPILMTSLTTIFSLLPFLFFTGIGTELQKPLALVIIAGMTIGTIISLYYIPLFYYFLKYKSVKL